jgi:ubiquinone/menaquinone biosynthesis C-methylase UbiE
MSDFAQPEGSQELHETPKNLFVDVGFGTYPVVNDGNKRFEGTNFYLGLDLDPKNIDNWRCQKHKDNPNVQFKLVEGNKDSFHFPLPDEAADEVHIGNVFGIPGAVDNHNLQLLLEESIRILKAGGKLTVLENLTPNYTQDQFEKLLRLFNLKITTSINAESPDWPKVVAEYKTLAAQNAPTKKIRSDLYFIAAEKPQLVSNQTGN